MEWVWLWFLTLVRMPVAIFFNFLFSGPFSCISGPFLSHFFSILGHFHAFYPIFLSIYLPTPATFPGRPPFCLLAQVNSVQKPSSLEPRGNARKKIFRAGDPRVPDSAFFKIFLIFSRSREKCEFLISEPSARGVGETRKK